MEFGPPALLLGDVVALLEDAICGACKPDQSQQAEDCALARLLAGIETPERAPLQQSF